MIIMIFNDTIIIIYLNDKKRNITIILLNCKLFNNNNLNMKYMIMIFNDKIIIIYLNDKKEISL